MKPSTTKLGFDRAKVKKYALRVVAVIATIGLVGFFVLPPIVKSVVLEKLGEALHRQVSVKSVSINPYALSVALEGVSIQEREGNEVFASFDSLYLNVESSSLFKSGLVVGEIRLQNPKIRIVRLTDKRYNFSDLVDEAMAKPKSEGPAPLFSLNNIQLSGGVIEFDDQPLHDKHVISAINLTVPFVSNMAYAVDSFVEPSFSAQINGAPLHIQGKSKPFSESLESEVSLDLDDLQIAKYLEYSPVPLSLKVKSGALDTRLKLAFIQESQKPAKLQLSGSAAVKALNVVDTAGAPLVSLKRLDVQVGSANLLGQKFAIEQIVLDSPEVNGRMNRAGVLNWSTLLPKDSAARKTESKAESKAEPKTESKAVVQSEPTSPVEWSLGELKVVGGSVRWLDESRSETLKTNVDSWGLSLKNLSSKGNTPADLTTQLKVNGKGAVALSGTVSPAPLTADLDLTVKTLELLPLQPVFSEKLNVAVTRGQITSNGSIQLRQGGKAGTGADNEISGSFSGDLTIGDFQAVDKINSADFLRWKSFYFGKIDVAFNPDSISVGDIALSDFFARIIVSPEGKLNLMQIVRKDEKSATSVVPQDAESKKTSVESSGGKAVSPVSPVAAENKALMPIKIGKITLQGGNVRFTDNFVKPNYTANLRKIGGRISGLSTEPGSTASLDLRGSYDNVAPLTIAAKINPLSVKPYLDLQAEIKGVELTPFSSYSGKYAGYAIEKGKLSLFVKYKIEENQLVAENRVFIDQLTFGDRVESPDATKLPVNLAISLLKNRKGEIDLDLPISGSLDDPQFSVGGLVIKVIVNLFVKAVTSPFALIGSMFGGGEELSNVEFDYGRAVISADSQKRLENLAKALIDRPSLKLEVEGRIDEQDREGLKRARIDRKVRAIKREDLTKKGIESGSAESVEVTPEEYPALLERAYRAEKFPKPRNMVGLVKTLPVDEMEKLMVTHAVVSDDDLRELGERRASVVRDWLVEHEVPAERVFILPTKPVEAERKAESESKAKGSRADFTLK